ncbi:contractile injection system tape measure protein [Rugamonas sp. CCM 8940]|uniref:contractile injection system tape measure protein n=1 Tax=Rugamonas sp. CCM 8940 TaxID=2765359 RepID=UPI0018F43233|nr:contractile injection system tape measure protein [Rugamonas sp. CCM 8940]MBJ7312000.1 hypothetical protein [Rugamonas sp. CCM 8940]
MQPNAPHSILRQYVDVRVAGSEAEALALQGRLAGLCAQWLTPVIERALDRCCPPRGVLRIERLEVDAGSIALGRLEQDLPALLERCLDQALSAHLAGGAEGGRAAPRHIDTALALDEALAHFLRYGTLPATLHLAAGMDFEASLLAAWRVDGGALAAPGAPAAPGGTALASGTASAPLRATQQLTALPAPAAELMAALRGASALQRLTGQFSISFQLALLARLAPGLAATLGAAVDAVDALGALAPGGTAASCARLLCRAALELALHGRAGDARLPIHGALSRGLPEQAARAALAALRSPLSASDAERQRGPAVLRAPAALVRPARPGGRRLASAAEQAGQHPERQQGIYIDNAGLVLLHPFLPKLFETLDLSEGERLLRPGRALALLHFLASGRTTAPEYALALPKLLCQLPLTAPVEDGVVLTAAECEEAEAMLAAVIRHWTALRSTSADGLRGAFLLRAGKLSERGGECLLQVEPQTADILLADLPWGVSALRLPWMERILWVEWT